MYSEVDQWLGNGWQIFIIDWEQFSMKGDGWLGLLAEEGLPELP